MEGRIMPKFTGTRLTEIAVERIGAAAKGKRIERPDALAPGLILRVDSHGRKAWWVRYRVGAKQTKALLGDWPEMSVETARDRAREVRREAERGVDPKAMRDARDAEDARAAETFTHLADAFFDVFAPRGANTKREMMTTVRTHLKPLAGVHKEKLHRSMLADITRALASPNREGGAKPGAARKAYEAASRIVRWAVSEGKLEHDPFHLMKPPAKGAPRERTLEHREIALLWQAWEAEGAPFGTMQKLLLLTATRRNEVARMQWREIDNPDAPTMWTIPAERAKNGKPHTIPLSVAARAVLATIPRGAGAFVFSTKDGVRPVSGFNHHKPLTDRLAAEIAEREGVAPVGAWTLHDLRRTARTGFARLGVAREVAERCINHVGGSQLERTYDRHTYEAEIADAFARWGAEVTRITGGAPESKVIALPRRA